VRLAVDMDAVEWESTAGPPVVVSLPVVLGDK